MEEKHRSQVEESWAYKHIVAKLQNIEEKKKILKVTRKKKACLPRKIIVILADFLLATKYYRKK